LRTKTINKQKRKGEKMRTVILILVTVLSIAFSAPAIAAEEKKVICEIDFSQKGKVVVISRGAADMREAPSPAKERWVKNMAVEAARVTALGCHNNIILHPKFRAKNFHLEFSEQKILNYETKKPLVWATIQTTYLVEWK
jgi:hypothetical protein